MTTTRAPLQLAAGPEDGAAPAAAREGWYSAQELAGLPGMPTTDRGVKKAAQKNLWSSRSKERGKGVEYALASLPAETRAHLMAQAVAAAAQRLDAQDALPALLRPTPLAAPTLTQPAAGQPLRLAPTRAQTRVQPTTALALPGHIEPGASAHATADARALAHAKTVVLAALDYLRVESGCSLEAAITTLLTNARSGQLATGTAAALARARDSRGRKGADGLPSPRSLKRWLGVRAAGGSLLPKQPDRQIEVLPWYALAVALRQRPQKPTYRWVSDAIAAQWNPAWGAEPPSYHTVYRFFTHTFSRIDALRGQHLGSSLRAHMFYQHRSAAGLAPFVEVHADGWNTHFTAPHPVTGEFVTYEIWHFHDVATRYVTPPSIGLSESFEVIAKGLENCIRIGGVPAVWQTDSTGAVKNDKMQLDPVTSIAERGGISIVHPQTVGNSQANGICENFNTWLDKESRELATYQGAKMDSLALKRTKKLTEKMVRAAAAGNLAERDALKREAERTGKGLVFDSHAHAVDWLLRKVEAYNRRPHRSLPKISDPVTGQRRHQTPAEALAEARAAGWAPVEMDEAALIDLFRPHFRKTVRRGCVSPFGGQRYTHPDLPHFEGQEVQVAIDVMDYRSVWVKDMDGRLICEAAFVEATGYRAQSMYEYALEKRARAQIRRKETQIEQISARMAMPALEAEAVAETELPAIDITAMYAEAEAVALLQPTQPATPGPLALRANDLNPEVVAAVTAPAATPTKPRYDYADDLAMAMYGDLIDEEDKARDKARDEKKAAG